MAGNHHTPVNVAFLHIHIQRGDENSGAIGSGQL